MRTLDYKSGGPKKKKKRMRRRWTLPKWSRSYGSANSWEGGEEKKEGVTMRGQGDLEHQWQVTKVLKDGKGGQTRPSENERH